MALLMPFSMSLTFPSIWTKPFWNSFSVSVFVGASVLSNISSICFGRRATASASFARI